jgi:hypothetical protein
MDLGRESSYAASSPGTVGNLFALFLDLSTFAVFFAFLAFFIVVVVSDAAFSSPLGWVECWLSD